MELFNKQMIERNEVLRTERSRDALRLRSFGFAQDLRSEIREQKSNPPSQDPFFGHQPVHDV